MRVLLRDIVVGIVGILLVPVCRSCLIRLLRDHIVVTSIIGCLGSVVILVRGVILGAFLILLVLHVIHFMIIGILLVIVLGHRFRIVLSPVSLII